MILLSFWKYYKKQILELTGRIFGMGLLGPANAPIPIYIEEK